MRCSEPDDADPVARERRVHPGLQRRSADPVRAPFDIAVPGGEEWNGRLAGDRGLLDCTASIADRAA